MGHEAMVSKKRVLATAEECVERTNQCIATVEEVRDKHNTLSTKVSGLVTEVDTLKVRAKSASAWCAQNEEQLKKRPTVDEMTRAIADSLETRPTLEDVGVCVAALLTEDRARLNAFLGMSWWARLKWTLFGLAPDAACTNPEQSPFGAPMMPWEHP